MPVNAYIAPAQDASTPARFVASSGSGSDETVTINTGGNVVVTPAAAIQDLVQSPARGRFPKDLSRYTQARLVGWKQAGGLAGQQLALQFSTDGGANWNYLDGATGPVVGALDTLPVGPFASPWVNLTATARADVLLRAAQGGGDGATTLTVGMLFAEFK